MPNSSITPKEPKTKRIERICPVCRTAYLVLPTRLSTGRDKGCSVACCRLLMAYPTLTKTCSGCQRGLPANTNYFGKRDKYGLQHLCNQCHASYYQQNKKRYAEHSKRWAIEHRDQRRAMRRNRNAVEKQAVGSHTAEDVQRQYKAQKGKCYWCGIAVGDTYHVDHVIPLTKGGSNGPENLVISCPPCNESKGDTLPHKWHGNGGKLL